MAEVQAEQGATQAEQTGVYFVILADKFGYVNKGQEVMQVLLESNKTGRLLF